MSSDFVNQITDNGYCHVRCDSTEAAEHLLLAAQDFLGAIMRHDRSRPDGLVPVEFKPGIRASERLISDTAGEAAAHMDGTFMSDPPGIIALGVIELSADAPQTYGIDFANLFNGLSDPIILEHSRQGSAQIRRADREASFTPLVFRNGRVELLYRYDDHVVIEHNGQSSQFRGLGSLINEANPTFYQLGLGSVIFFDNRRYLHGRQAFDPVQQRRLLLRAWYPGQVGDTRLTLGVPWSGRPAEGKMPSSSAMEHFGFAIQVQGNSISIDPTSASSSAADDHLDGIIFAVKQAIGYRHSPRYWEDHRNGKEAQLSAYDLGCGDGFGAWLASDLSYLLHGRSD